MKEIDKSIESFRKKKDFITLGKVSTTVFSIILKKIKGLELIEHKEILDFAIIPTLLSLEEVKKCWRAMETLELNVVLQDDTVIKKGNEDFNHKFIEDIINKIFEKEVK